MLSITFPGQIQASDFTRFSNLEVITNINTGKMQSHVECSVCVYAKTLSDKSLLHLAQAWCLNWV